MILIGRRATKRSQILVNEMPMASLGRQLFREKKGSCSVIPAASAGLVGKHDTHASKEQCGLPDRETLGVKAEWRGGLAEPWRRGGAPLFGQNGVSFDIIK